MTSSLDEVVALHIGGLALELCKQVKMTADLQEELKEVKQKLADIQKDPEVKVK